LVVTDSFLYQSGAAAKVGAVLSEAGVEYAVYYNVSPNPTIDIVNECIRAAKALNVDLLLALGGGSAIDTAKAVSIVVANGGSVEQYEGVERSSRPGIPIAAINTTAGTGSECTSFYIVTDPVRHSKMTMVDTNCMVSIAINDIDFMMTMPPKLTAATGMDALTHAIEAVLSKNATPLTDKDALWAIRTIIEYLPRAVRNGNDEEARTMMAYAENVAGMAFSNAGLGMVHAMAHALGGHYNLPHGVCNAVLLPYVLEFNGKHAETASDFVKIADAMNLNRSDAASVIEAVRSLRAEVGIAGSLKELKGVSQNDFEALAALAMKDSCMSTNPVSPNPEQVIAVYRTAYCER
jgi:alcohol dehydrogenase